MSATPAPAPASAGALQGNTPAGAPPAAAGNHASGSLYVGDLQSDVTEALLFEVFNPVGPVSSIRVCRDASSRMSLGYAYVNFHSVVDAERALDTLNFSPIKGRPCRIMWSHRDPSARKNATSNIFIKNLDKTVDNKTLYDTFSRFGSILSCKVATDPSLQSRGFAFVHYEKEEDAQKAIDEVNGMMLAGKKVFVGKFERRANRSGGSESKFTNVYVKNIPNEWDEAKFREEFGKFGTITSLVLQTDAEGKHKGFGFVNYDTHDEAVSAKEEGGKIPTGNDKPLFVDRFQKKAERSAILQRRYEDQQREKSERYKNLNLYVKNFEDDMTDEKLRELFEQHGEVSSAVVMKDERENSRGFGFVCFSNPDDASKALAALNGKMIGTKPLYVNRAQRKDERRAHLEGQFQANFAGQRIAPLAPVFFNPAGMMGPMAMYNQFGGVRGGGNRFPQHSGMRYPGAGYPGSQMKRGGRAPQQGRQGVPGGPGRSANPQKFRQAGPGGPRGYRDSSVPMPMPAVPSPMAAQPAHVDLTKILAHSDPETQKQVLGERLFPLVQQEKPELAGKITGMLLEMDTSDILGLIESQSELRSKIDEAMNVLQSHTTAEGSA